MLQDLQTRGLNTPLLAIGDGALGFWAALREAQGYERTSEQRCWVHKIANVLDKLPKRVQPRGKIALARNDAIGNSLGGGSGQAKIPSRFPRKISRGSQEDRKGLAGAHNILPVPCHALAAHPYNKRY